MGLTAWEELEVYIAGGGDLGPPPGCPRIAAHWLRLWYARLPRDSGLRESVCEIARELLGGELAGELQPGDAMREALAITDWLIRKVLPIALHMTALEDLRRHGAALDALHPLRGLPSTAVLEAVDAAGAAVRARLSFQSGGHTATARMAMAAISSARQAMGGIDPSTDRGLDRLEATVFFIAAHLAYGGGSAAEERVRTLEAALRESATKRLREIVGGLKRGGEANGG